MKKRKVKSLALHKKSISSLDNSVKGGADTIESLNPLCANTGCIGEPKHTCGIINCNLTIDAE